MQEMGPLPSMSEHHSRREPLQVPRLDQGREVRVLDAGEQRQRPDKIGVGWLHGFVARWYANLDKSQSKN